jgi:hypothetical protein
MARKKPFKKLDILLPREGARVRVSEFHRKYLAKQDNFWEYVGAVESGQMDIGDAIFTLTGVNKSDDLIAYSAFRDVIESFTGAQKRVNDMEKVSLYSMTDAALIFNSRKKIDAFMHYFVSYIVNKKINNQRPAVIVEGSLCIDYYLFLQIVEDYLVNECVAERETAKQYMLKYFLGYYGAFFMVFVNFKLQNMLVSMKIPDMVYMKNSKIKGGGIVKTECLHAWIPALYSDDEGNELYFRQIQFSLKLMRKMAMENEKEFDEYLFDKVLFDRMVDLLEREELTQLYWAKDASEALREAEKSGSDSHKYFYLYHEKR